VLIVFWNLTGTVSVINFDKSLRQSESTQPNTSKWYYARRLLHWFCGLESPGVSTPKQKTRCGDMTLLHQTWRARAALYTALTLLITLDLFLYGFFSSGSDFGLLRNSRPFAVNTTAIPLPGNHLTVLLNHTLGM